MFDTWVGPIVKSGPGGRDYVYPPLQLVPSKQALKFCRNELE